jgi:Expansin C-terminal domain
VITLYEADLVIGSQDVGATGAIRTVQIKGRDGSWQGMENTWGAAWEVSKSPSPPLDLRIVADDSQEVSRLLK